MNLSLQETFDGLSKQLGKEDIESVMRGELWEKAMDLMADKINTASARANSESDVATNMDSELLRFSDSVLVRSGQKPFELNKEVTVDLQKNALEDKDLKLSQAKGRIDSKFSSVIIEYKKPAAYKNKTDTDKAFKQATDYLNSLYEEEKGTYLGLITDGTRCQFVVFNTHAKECYDKDWHRVNPETDVRRLDGKMVDKLIRGIINLQVKALTAENLIDDLVNKKVNGKNVIVHLTEALYDSLSIGMDSSTAVSYGQWMNNFGLSHDDASKQKAIEDRRKDLAAIIDREKIDTNDEYKILFAMQSAVAILAMLIVYRVVVLIRGKGNVSFRDLLAMDVNERCIELGKIATGSASLEFNVFNIMEIGCFGWPFSSDEYWTDSVNKYVCEVIEILMRYETMPDFTIHTDDLFKELYMKIMPASVRHSLGEYYTPSWLANNVIDSGLAYVPYDKKHLRVIDTTAGSGTFIQKVIERKRVLYSSEDPNDALHYILNEVVAIDANTLSVILARINYFMAIADLIHSDDEVYIPVFIGDSSIPLVNMKSTDSKFYVDTIQFDNGKEIKIEIPESATKNQKDFINKMEKIPYVADESDEALKRSLNKICKNEWELSEITDSWLEMRKKGLITPAVINSMINTYLLCNVGKFDLIVGNPPWVDWKTLPSVHRENKKEICYARNLFSGDGRTGGNSLNICALISNISAENWLAHGGVMSILMPQSILFQQSYEGYRKLNLVDGRKLYFQEIIDWSKSGHPFSPVQQLFCTYVISESKQDYSHGIKLEKVYLKKGNKLENIKNNITKATFLDYFKIEEGVVGKASNNRSAFTYAKDTVELSYFNEIAGSTGYIGREGVEYYPQELQLLKYKRINKDGSILLENYQSNRSKIKVAKQTPSLEALYLRPLIKGVNVSRFHVEPSEYIVPFPYDAKHVQVPLSAEELLDSSPELMRYYRTNKEYLTAQTEYSDKIIGKEDAPYYALARTGKYCHADWYVIFRDNTKWVAAVTGKIETEWGGLKKPAFQNHCVSVCERADGSYITEDEAHYLCAILNSHVVEDFVMSTSDKRTFKIRIPVKILPYDETNNIHVQLATLSKKAHNAYNDKNSIEKIRTKIDELYIASLK